MTRTSLMFVTGLNSKTWQQTNGRCSLQPATMCFSDSTFATEHCTRYVRAAKIM